MLCQALPFTDKDFPVAQKKQLDQLSTDRNDDDALQVF